MIFLHFFDKYHSEPLLPQEAIDWLDFRSLITPEGKVKPGTYIEDHSSSCKNLLFSLQIKETPKHYQITYSVDRMRGREVVKSELRTVRCGIDQSLLKLVGFARYLEWRVDDLKKGDRLYHSKDLRESIDKEPVCYTDVFLMVRNVELIDEPLTVLDVKTKTGHYDWYDIVLCE